MRMTLQSAGVAPPPRNDTARWLSQSLDPEAGPQFALALRARRVCHVYVLVLQLPRYVPQPSVPSTRAGRPATQGTIVPRTPCVTVVVRPAKHRIRTLGPCLVDSLSLHVYTLVFNYKTVLSFTSLWFVRVLCPLHRTTSLLLIYCLVDCCSLLVAIT